MDTAPFLLIIDDDVMWCDALKNLLMIKDFKVELAYDALTGLQKAYTLKPDAILLDIMLPGMSGWQVCNRFREMSDVPIIMLTALSSTQDVVQGLGCGADDYIVKTVGNGELVARIRAVLRRIRPSYKGSNGYQETVFQHDNLVVDFHKHRILVDNNPISLTPTEFRLLSTLVKHKGRVLPHNFLLKQVWGPGYEGDLICLRMYIGYLRRKIEKNPSEPRLIQNEWGVGYRFG